jgi:hypothetical protein
MPFVKLDTRILDSTLWLDATASRIFITALLMADPWELTEPKEQLEVRSLERTGFVVPAGWYGWIAAAGIGIIGRAHIGKAEGYAALEALGSADDESRSKEFEGRRLVRVDGGYIVLNYMKFRDFDHGAKERMKRLRDRKKGEPKLEPEAEHEPVRCNVTTVRPNTADVHPNVTHSREQIADSREQIEERTKTTDPDGSSASSKTTKTKNRGGRSAAEDVEKVRQAYPLKKAPGADRKAIEKAMTRLQDRGESDPAGFLIARIVEWKAARDRDGAAGRFVPDCPHAATWFNQERYDAEGLQPAKNCVLPNGKLGTAAELREQTGWQVIRGAV